MNFRNTIAKTIKEKRVSMDLTQDQLSQKLGYTANTIITAWEKCKKVPTTEMLVKLSEIFSCSVDELLFGKSSGHEGEERIKAYRDKYEKALEELNAERQKNQVLREKLDDIKDAVLESTGYIEGEKNTMWTHLKKVLLG